MLRKIIGLMVPACALALLCACQGSEGDKGEVTVRFRNDPTVNQTTLIGVGIPVTASLADPNTVFILPRLAGRIDWQVTGVDYTTLVDIEPNKGKKGRSGFFPQGTLGCDDCGSWTAVQGRDGRNIDLTALFVGTQLMLFTDSSAITGQ